MKERIILAVVLILGINVPTVATASIQEWCKVVNKTVKTMIFRPEMGQKVLNQAASLGFDVNARMTGLAMMEPEIEAFFSKALVDELIHDLTRMKSYQGRNMVGEVMKLKSASGFANKEEAMAGLGLREDRRTVSVLYDDGAIEITTLAGYYDARPLQWYGLPLSAPMNTVVGLPSRRGFVIKFGEQGSGSTYVQRFYAFSSKDRANGYVNARNGQLKDALIAYYREGMQNGEALYRLIQRIRKKIEEKIGWNEFYDAYGQYFALRGSTGYFQRTESLIFLPGPDAGSITAVGYTTKDQHPEDLILSLTSNKAIKIQDVNITLNKPPEGAISRALKFTAVLKQN